MRTETSTSSDSIPQEPPKDWTTAYGETLEKRGGGWPSGLGDLVNTSVPRLFLISAFAIYGVIAFSKKEKGVENNDLAFLLFFIVFIFLVSGLLVIGRDMYRSRIIYQLLSFGLFENLKKKIRILILAFLITLGIIILLKSYMLTIIIKFISWFL